MSISRIQYNPNIQSPNIYGGYQSVAQPKKPELNQLFTFKGNEGIQESTKAGQQAAVSGAIQQPKQNQTSVDKTIRGDEFVPSTKSVEQAISVKPGENGSVNETGKVKRQPEAITSEIEKNVGKFQTPVDNQNRQGSYTTSPDGKVGFAGQKLYLMA